MELPEFDTISLEELGAATLQNRIDSKYPLSVKRATEVLQGLAHYNAVEVEQEILLPYKTLYYDTDDYQLYKTHLRGKANRLKFRSRRYSTGAMFHETKLKNNKGRTIKQRVSASRQEKFSIPPFPERHLFALGEELKPVLYVYYTRLTLAAPDFSERVTIDFDLHYKFDGQEATYPDIAIVELKRCRGDQLTEAAKLLRDHRVKSRGFSKYCIGLASINNTLPRHALNLKLRTIERLSQENVA